MDKRSFFPILLASLITWWVGSGLLPLLPIYAKSLGAGPAMIGNYLSVVYLMLALGTAGAGWLAGKLGRRRLLFFCTSLMCVPATWLMGRAGDIWQLAFFTSVVWFASDRSAQRVDRCLCRQQHCDVTDLAGQ